jgi:hypothetical protein
MPMPSLKKKEKRKDTKKERKKCRLALQPLPSEEFLISIFFVELTIACDTHLRNCR